MLICFCSGTVAIFLYPAFLVPFRCIVTQGLQGVKMGTFIFDPAFRHTFL